MIYFIYVLVGGIVTLIWYRPLIRGIKSYQFWNMINNESTKATEYFRHSHFWKIEAYNEGIINDWFGPYIIKSRGIKFFVYCKTDDVSKYISDFKNFKIES